VWNRLSFIRSAAAAALLSVMVAGSAAATDQIYFSSATNVTDLLVQHINAETVRVTSRAGI